ncbi:MAG: bifunctional (p)ppGpp synthetase/guanosine-3',5'-bis(diphosphate) 3'-pyrophosphohydrolase [Desulfovibrionaceae bacterium]|nr:bifunctional (p)ppGpp synthetase/guanosine-3',5'-bis(diphosphate) 3'-pyrophosphohydrolase [Desulfovibrionaceae bacterium]
MQSSALKSTASSPETSDAPVRIFIPAVVRIQDIIDKVRSIQQDADTTLLQRAYVYAAQAHAGQVRLSGEPYLSHPLAVAYILADMRMDEATIASGLLHDTVEDTDTTVEDIDKMFGPDVAQIVDGVSKISLMKFESKEEAQAENIRKMILAMAEDMQVLMVKLADRLHNMRTLEFQKPHKQMRIAQETMDIYVPLANRLGLHRIKLELEDLSFMYLKPDIYVQMSDWLDRNFAQDNQYIQRIRSDLRTMLDEAGIHGEILGRIKHKYSIYKKMLQQNLTLDQVHDILAFRVIVNEVKSCYAVLGLVHSAWKSVQGRFKDYISMPKANMYQSLHTTVVGPEGERFEIQIRTWEMDRMAEHGVASHWHYKENGRIAAKNVAQFAWLHELLDWQKQESNSKEFMHSLRFDMFKDEIYVFTPRGDVLELPEGATPVDFAFMIHSKVGAQTSGAKVNGKLVPINTRLRSGDSVEIITDPNRHPSRDWLKFIKTAKARTYINNYIRTEERTRSISLGREMLEKQGRRMGINFLKLKEIELEELAEELKFKSAEEMFSAVGYARITPRKVLNRLMPKEEELAAPSSEAARPELETAAPQKSEGVVISGVDDVLVRFAGCCTPIPGDHIVGYISRGRGITVHTCDCVNLPNMEPERLIPVYWEGHAGRPYPSRISIVADNKPGVLAGIAAVLAENSVNIDSGQIRSHVDGKTIIDFTVEVTDVAQLYQTIDVISKLEHIVEVSRASGGAEN